MIVPRDWAPAKGVTLEPNALRAATELVDNVVVSAGPGAGKTELLAQRADFLLRTGVCPYPRRILAISFKVDAAATLNNRVRERCGRDLASRLDSVTFHALAKRLIDNYRPLLTGSKALTADYAIHPRDRIPGRQITFDDLVPLAIDILHLSPHALGGLRQTYSQVFLDEFQDSTSSQYRLIKGIFAGTSTRLTAVGDTKQKIMSFAGAVDGILETFAIDFNATRLSLYQNYRSAPLIRRMHNRMVLVMDPSAALPAGEPTGTPGIVVKRSFDADNKEAVAVVDLVERWIAEGTPLSEIAILIRNQPHLYGAKIQAELAVRGIPSRNEAALQDLAAEPASSLVLCLLRVLVLDRDPNAYSELTRLAARRGLSDEGGRRYDSKQKRFVSEKRKLVRSAVFDRTAFADWHAIMEEFRTLVTEPVIVALAPGYEIASRLAEVTSQIDTAIEVALSAAGSIEDALKRLSDVEAVRLLTIHKCKGMEFAKVVVVGVETQMFWGNDAKAEFFVAISRAKDELHLTSSDFRARPAGHSGRWEESRTQHNEFLGYADE